jgi:hypothetical protein
MLVFADLLVTKDNAQSDPRLADYRSVFSNSGKEKPVSRHVRIEPQQPTPDFDRISHLISGRKD